MIGCIVTGHGEFAGGLAQALTMIAGEQEHFEAVPFRETEPLDGFAERMKAALQRLLGQTDGVLIFTDLLGGTPFRTAMLAAAGHENVAVLTGTNLPMLIEIGLMRSAQSDVQALARTAEEAGRAGIQAARLEPGGSAPPSGAGSDDDSEGI
ncbi:MAG: PTS N-acetylgalactosamine IIA subunit [Symbiobacterium thermophilum]|uniref:PTS N-acetylgalactosamine IIA subunit n=2 Tax=Symbiobacterium thermophilum TaxID=2734 RepID=A0A1Y2TB08_SYMTR|nr:MAG: PTS N-acetylgalactosamine IIA subunit [Symbiobacterium thermophilum]